MNDAFDSPIGLAWALVKRHKQRKQIRKIQKGNVESQGIIEYNPSHIEAFFDNTEPWREVSNVHIVKDMCL